jgi:hypothetical protein
MAGAHIPLVKFNAWMCAWVGSSRCTSTLVVSTYDNLHGQFPGPSPELLPPSHKKDPTNNFT